MGKIYTQYITCGEETNLQPVEFERKFTITWDVNGGVIPEEETSYTKEVSTNFKQWSTESDGSGTIYEDQASVKDLANKGGVFDLYVNWEDDSHTIGELTPPTPTRTGYTFAGWFTQIEGEETIEVVKSKIINTNLTFYAHWTPITYTITFNGNGANPGTMADMSLSYDEIKSLTENTFTKTGYIFQGWEEQS